MKFKIFIALTCFTLIILSSCNLLTAKDPTEDETDESKYLSIVTSLEQKLEKLSAEYYASEKIKEESIEKLKEQLEAISKKSEDSEQKDNEQEKENENDAPSVEPESFSYLVSEKGAIITGYSGKTEILVIPSYIDGIKVYGIGESAFALSEVKTVIVSDGVEYIDWFAFFNSPFLSSVTIPDSVTRIEYSAFDGTSSSLVIYCHKDSYAYSYARSYGLEYALI